MAGKKFHKLIKCSSSSILFTKNHQNLKCVYLTRPMYRFDISYNFQVLRFSFDFYRAFAYSEI